MLCFINLANSDKFTGCHCWELSF